jgi:iron(III) transport system permease protein
VTRLPRSTIVAICALALVAVFGVSMTDARSRGLLFNTLQLVWGALAIALPVGGFLGLTLSRSDVFGRPAAAGFLGAMLLVPLYLQAAAWQAGFGLTGWHTTLQATGSVEPWLDGWRGAIWVHGCAGVAWVALFVGAAARSIPRAWEELALLDLSPAGVFARVTLRLLLPGLALGALWVAIVVATEMSVTDLFAVRTYAEELYIELNLGSWNAIMDTGPPDDSPLPALPGIVVTAAAALGVLVIGQRLMVASSPATVQRPLVFSLGRWRLPVTLVAWLLVGLVVLLPFANLIYKAGAVVAETDGEYMRGWSVAKFVEVMRTTPSDHAVEMGWSFAIATCAAAVAMLFAAPLAYACRSSRLAQIVSALVAVVGLAVPGPLVALGLISVFNDPAWPPLNYLYDDTIAVPVLAQALRAFPLTFFLLWQAMQTIPRPLVEVALVDGAGPIRRLWLALRQRPTAVALALLAALIISLGELTATILVVAPGKTPLSVHIFQLLHYNVEDQVAAISLMLILVHAAGGLALVIVGRRLFRIG